MGFENSGMKSDSVRAAGQFYIAKGKSAHYFPTLKPKTREDSPKPKLSLVEWFIVGPIVVGLGFMAGIMWP
jgi:hypothetical protein